MNLEVILMVAIVVLICILIYGHYKTKESFTFTDIAAGNTQIATDLNTLNTTLSNNISRSTIPQDNNLLYYLYNQYLADNKTNIIDTASPASINSSIINDVAFLENQVTAIPDNVKVFKSIKSTQNGMNLNIERTDDGYYQVLVNKGCLRVPGAGPYSIVDCNSKDSSQKFDAVSITSDAYYNSVLEPGIDGNKVSPNDKFQYPFIVMKTLDSDNCLQNNHGSLSVEPCRILKSQRWLGLEKPVICK